MLSDQVGVIGVLQAAGGRVPGCQWLAAGHAVQAGCREILRGGILQSPGREASQCA